MVGLYDRCYLEGQKAIGPGKTLRGGGALWNGIQTFRCPIFSDCTYFPDVTWMVIVTFGGLHSRSFKVF